MIQAVSAVSIFPELLALIWILCIIRNMSLLQIRDVSLLLYKNSFISVFVVQLHFFYFGFRALFSHINNLPPIRGYHCPRSEMNLHSI